MKQRILLILFSILLGGCNLAPKKAGVEIMSNPAATVYIDGQEAGSTPYKNTNLKPEEVEIKLTTNSQEWKKKIKLLNNVNTVVNWSFDEKSGQGGGYLLYLERTGDESKSGLMVNATPDKCSVNIDGQVKGYSPLRLDDIGEQDKQVVISYPAHKTINVFVKPAKGYQLIIEAFLQKEELPQVAIETTPTGSPLSTPSATLNTAMVEINSPDTGWLRVRDSASGGGREISRVNNGEKYKLLEEQSEWWQIELGDGTKGWISSKYAEKL